jgi:hypothetical protein
LAGVLTISGGTALMIAAFATFLSPTGIASLGFGIFRRFPDFRGARRCTAFLVMLTKRSVAEKAPTSPLNSALAYLCQTHLVEIDNADRSEIQANSRKQSRAFAGELGYRRHAMRRGHSRWFFPLSIQPKEYLELDIAIDIAARYRSTLHNERRPSRRVKDHRKQL